VLKHLRSRTADKNLLQKGFTLVELLVVIVILGILAAVVVFAVGGTEQDARVKSCLAERNTVEAAAISYLSAKDSNPALGALSVNALLNSDPKFLQHPPKYWDVDGAGDLSRKAGTEPSTALCDTTTGD
jgi:general secretion pathway protein G